MSKTSISIAIFALILCFSYAQTPGGYTTVSPSQYNDTYVQKFMHYGIDIIISADVIKGKIDPNYGPANFSVSQINSIQTQVVAGMNYKYNLTLTSSDNYYTVNAQFIVYNQAWNNITRLASWSNNISWNSSNKTSIAGGYTTVPASQYNNSDIQEFLQFGVGQTISQAINDNDIPTGTYNLSSFNVKINSIQTQIVSGMNYKYNLTLTSTDNAVTIFTEFIVYNQAWTNCTELISLDFYVQYQLAGGYTSIPPSQYNNSDIQGFMQFGIENVVEAAINAGKLNSSYLPSKFSLLTINSIAEQIVNGINYKFNIFIQSSDRKVTITTTFVVYNQAWTNTTDMESYVYNINTKH